MVRDRLKEFHEKQGNTNSEDEIEDTVVPTHGVTPVVVPGNDVVIEMGWIDSDIGRFLKQVESLKEKIDEIRSDVEKIKYLQGSLLDSPTRDEVKETELDRLLASVKTESRDLMKKLKEMEEANAAEAKINPTEVTFTRIKKTQHGALLKSFGNLLDYYQGVQISYQEKCKARVKTMTVIRNGNLDMDEEDEDDLLEDGKRHLGNISVFTEGDFLRPLLVQYQEKTESARHELALADARLNDLLKIETALRELHDLFIEMAGLVVLQGEKVDNIERLVTEAKDFVAAADEQLVNAQKLQTSARKKKIIIIIVIIILLVVLGLIIYLSIPKSSSK